MMKDINRNVLQRVRMKGEGHSVLIRLYRMKYCVDIYCKLSTTIQSTQRSKALTICTKTMTDLF